MAGWMAGWMDLMDGWIDGWMDGWMIDGGTDKFCQQMKYSMLYCDQTCISQMLVAISQSSLLDAYSSNIILCIVWNMCLDLFYMTNISNIKQLIERGLLITIDIKYIIYLIYNPLLILFFQSIYHSFLYPIINLFFSIHPLIYLSIHPFTYVFGHGVSYVK